MSIDNTLPTFDDDEIITQEELEGQVQRKVSTMDDAVRYAYGISKTQEEIDTLMATAEAEIEKWRQRIQQVEEWRDSQINPLQDKLDFMKGLLLGFHVEQYYNAPNEKAQAKLKSIKLPYGVTLKSTQPQISFEIADEDAYKTYMEASGFTEPQEPKLKWADFKKSLVVDGNGTVVTQDGEVVGFLRAVAQDRKFEVK